VIRWWGLTWELTCAVRPAEKATPIDDAGALLRVSGLSKGFGGVQAVRDCSFAIPSGKIIGLIGPNGAGKSTTLDLISGFKRADSGSVRFDGREIRGMPPHNISRLGLMRTFQTPREWPLLTVMENMLLAAPARGRDAVWRALVTPRRLQRLEAEDRVGARQMLKQFGLIRLKDEPAGNLSGGQKRLLEFARILFARPRMVLLDEPLAGVNPVLAGRMTEAISTLSGEGITLLMVEHNLQLVETVCDSVIVMDLGTAIAEGSMGQLRQNAAVVDAYLGEVPTVEVPTGV
jgi:ABC-type branched-subunit amino acid transport system ATPase component